MNTYDFDKTVFYPDSSYCFYKYCLKHYPAAVLRTLPKTVGILKDYLKDKSDAKPLKEQLFSFLRYIPDVDSVIETFWQENFCRMEKWYMEQKRADDIIISASPEFLLKPVTDKLGVRLIGTPMDKKTGKINGANCHDSEKVRRFCEQYPNAVTECFYSDSLSDTPMAQIAEKAYIVDHGKLTPWPDI